MTARKRTARKRDAGPPVPLPVKIVGRTAGSLALLGAVALVAILVIAIPATAGRSSGMEDGPWRFALLNIALPTMGGSLILSVLLALLNAVGISPWFDNKTGRFVRPTGAADWAVGIAAISGGIIVVGWFGVVAGLMLGAGFVGVVVGQTSENGAAFVLGAIALAFAVATYYAGGRLRGTIPSAVGSYAASGGYFFLGVGFLVDAALTGNPTMIVGGLAGIASTAGYIIGGMLQARRARHTPAQA